MTLSRLFLSAALLLAGTLAQADIIKPGSDYGDRDRDGRWSGRNDRTTQEIYIGRYVRNESINLLQEIRHFRGYRVEAVCVFVQRSREVSASLELIVNGRSEDSTGVDVGRANVLKPRSIVDVGRHLNDLEIYARGEMLIDRIVIQLSSETQRPPPFEDDREISVPLNLPPYLPPQPRLDLTPYVDTQRYRGYVIRGVEITAVSRGNYYAALDILLNGYFDGQMSFSPHQSTQIVRSRQNLVIGSSFGSLVLAPRGDSNILQIRLILSRN